MFSKGNRVVESSHGRFRPMERTGGQRRRYNQPPRTSSDESNIAAVGAGEKDRKVPECIHEERDGQGVLGH